MTKPATKIQLLSHNDLSLLKELLQGRINAVRSTTFLDRGEIRRLVNEYEQVLHRLSDFRLIDVVGA